MNSRVICGDIYSVGWIPRPLALRSERLAKFLTCARDECRNQPEGRGDHDFHNTMVCEAPGSSQTAAPG